METTTNFGLKKPGAEDFYNVQDQNDNMDKIDQTMNEHKEELNILKSGTSGQFLVSSGASGAEWKTVPDAEGVTV